MTSRSLDTDILQVRTLYARTPQNGFIPSSHIIIANGDGSTRWNSVSSIVPVSSFGVVYGNSLTPPLYGDLSSNILQISTTGVGNIFQSYVDPVAKCLMLSNTLPPIAVGIGSVPAVSLPAATTVPNPEFLKPVTGLSTIKYLGVGDIKLSTITEQNAIFISISSFTSVGYSTISGETFQWRPTVASTLSTSAGLASFISSVTPVYQVGPSGITMATTGIDIYFSSFTFSANHLMPYINTRTSNTRMFVELQPTFFFPPLYQTQDSPEVIKEMSSYIQQEKISGIFQESVTTKYITSQVINTELSNYFTTSVRMELNPYTVASNVAANLPLSTNYTIYHRIAYGLSNLGNPGFAPDPTYSNNTSQNGLYIQMMNGGVTLF